MELAFLEIFCQLFIRLINPKLLIKLHIPTIFRFSWYCHLTSHTKDNILAIIQNWIVFYCFLRAKCFFNFLLYIFNWVFHENSGVRITLWHFLLALNKSRYHSVRNNNRFSFLIFTIFYGKHIHFSLVDAQLAKIDIKEKYISALHTRIKELWYFQLVWLFFAHNCCTFLDSGNSVLASNIHNSHPILIWSFVNLLRSPNEFHILELHPCSPPNLYKIFPYCSDFL